MEASETMEMARAQHYLVIRTTEARRRIVAWDEAAFSNQPQALVVRIRDEEVAETMEMARVQYYLVIRTIFLKAEARRRIVDWDEAAAEVTYNGVERKT